MEKIQMWQPIKMFLWNSHVMGKLNIHNVFVNHDTMGFRLEYCIMTNLDIDLDQIKKW